MATSTALGPKAKSAPVLSWVTLNAGKSVWDQVRSTLMMAERYGERIKRREGKAGGETDKAL